MGILSNSVSFCQFKVIGSKPEMTQFDNVSSKLKSFAFKPIDESTEELSIGWVHLDDSNASSFSTPRDFFRDHFITMTLRKDQRRIPGVLLKASLEKAEIEYLQANPGTKLPKEEKADLAETVKAVLCSKTLPSPSMYDVVWDTNANILSFASLSSSVTENFIRLFTETFEGVSLELVSPYIRAEMVVTEPLKKALEKSNKSTSSDALSLIEDNLWLGSDFLLWLMFQSVEGTSIYNVNSDGILQSGEEFIAFIDEKLLLVGNDDRGIQKVTVVGPQSQFLEVTTALKEKKQITEATILFELKEEAWKLTLKSGMFSFAGFKTPTVKLEKEGVFDPGGEREALFFEKMLLIEKGVQLFNSLFKNFLETRLNGTWAGEEKKIDKWLEAP